MRFLLFLCLVNTALAQNFQITEISPHTLGDQAEWFEFYVDEEVDLSQYQVSNTKNLPKPLTTALEGENEGYYYFEKSPVSLANDGGTIQILGLAGTIAHEVNYPKTKSGTKSGEKWIEVWNWSEKYQQFLPLISKFTPGKENLKLPTPVDQLTLLFSEASPDKDFLELYLKHGPEDTNLKGLSVKHNGSTVLEYPTDKIIEPGDFILIQAPISGGSGTVELIAHTGTSLESVLDVVCWQDETLSKTEAKRVKKFKENKSWSGDCYEYGESIKNESISRNIDFTDTNSSSDLKPHYNGSPGSANTITNEPPQAVITIQGSGKRLGTPPFSLNVTGEESTDPDGSKDLKGFVWTLNGEIFSEDLNPKNIKLESINNYQLELTVTDYSGASSVTTETIFVTAGVSAPSAKSAPEFVAHLEEAIKLSKNNKAVPNTHEDFFAPVFRNEAFMTALFQKKDPVPVYPDYEPEIVKKEPPAEDFVRRIKLPRFVRERLSRNLGLIWDWRETRWAAGVGSISDGAIDQNSERFVVAFGVP